MIRELLNAFVWGYSGIFWSNPNMQKYDVVINLCTAESGYWQNYIDYILTINASLLLCEESSAATVLYDA